MAVNRPYTPRDWETGDVITEEFLDNIEEGISAIDSEIYEARGLNPSSTTLKQRIDDLVIIQNTKPTSDNNKIWIKGTSNSVRVPSYNEAAATYATNLWIDTETNLLYLLNRNGEPISDGIAVPTGSGGGEGGGGGITINSRLSTTSINPVQNKVITNALNLKEDISNKITTITSASTDTQYPSAAAVWALFNSISNADATSY